MRYFNVFTLMCLLLLSPLSLADQSYFVSDGETLHVPFSRQFPNHLFISGENIIGFQGSIERCPITMCARLEFFYGGIHSEALNHPILFAINTDKGHHIIVIAKPTEAPSQFITVEIES